MPSINSKSFAIYTLITILCTIKYELIVIFIFSKYNLAKFHNDILISVDSNLQ